MIHRHYWGEPGARVHVATNEPFRAGSDRAVVMLPQCPRSWDEYREVLERLPLPAVALDPPGYGASDAPAEHTIEAYATPIIDALETSGIAGIDLVGHHTGGLVAVEVASRLVAPVRRLVLSSTPLVDHEERARRMHGRESAIDTAEHHVDGRHLESLWAGRAPYYPPRVELLDRYMSDALRAQDPAGGHRAVTGYDLLARLPLPVESVLCIGHQKDPFGMRHHERLVDATGAREHVISDGHIPLEYTAREFAEVITDFLDP